MEKAKRAKKRWVLLESRQILPAVIRFPCEVPGSPRLFPLSATTIGVGSREKGIHQFAADGEPGLDAGWLI